MSRDFRGGFFTNLHSSEGAVITDLSTREKKKKNNRKNPKCWLPAVRRDNSQLDSCQLPSYWNRIKKVSLLDCRSLVHFTFKRKLKLTV